MLEWTLKPRSPLSSAVFRRPQQGGGGAPALGLAPPHLGAPGVLGPGFPLAQLIDWSPVWREQGVGMIGGGGGGMLVGVVEMPL